MSREADEIRLARIEEKVDDLAQAFVILARVEEKQAQMEALRIESNRRTDHNIQSILSEIKELRQNQNDQDKAVAENTRITNNLSKFFWILVSTVATAVIGTLVINFLT
jgi:hypothetical protein